MLPVYVCIFATYTVTVSHSTTMHMQPHTHYVTEKGLGLVVIGRVNRSYQFTYLPGEEVNSWPGGLWHCHFFMFSCLPCAWKVGNIHSFLPTLYWLPGGVIPYDGIPLEEVVSVHPSLTVIFSILATAGIAFAVACLVFNFIFGNRKYVAIMFDHS